MQNLNILEDYVYDILGIKVRVNKVDIASRLPFYLQNNYHFYSIQIYNHDYNLMLANDENEITPAQINKHIGVVKEKTGRETIFCCSRISSFNRKRLIEYKIPFIIPGNQMFLPDIGIDLREYYKYRKQATGKLSPSTQVIVLDALLNHDYTPKTTSQLSNKLPYTKMTIGRAFDELEANEIAKIEMLGKERILHFNHTGKELWDTVYSLLRNPIAKRIYINELNPKESMPISGFTALSLETMISESQYRTYAMSREEYKLLQIRNNVVELEYPAQDAIEIEIWSYSPRLLSQGERVDNLSLYLSLKDNEDERVEMALESLLEQIL